MIDVLILLGEKLGLPVWATVAVCLLIGFLLYKGGAWIQRWRDHHRHTTNHFPDRFLVGRNTLIYGTLKEPVLALRTLMSGDISEHLVTDPVLATVIEEAGQKTTIDCPAVILADEAKHRQMWADVVSTVSPKIQTGKPRQLVMITRECYPGMKERKQQMLIRVLLASEDMLRAFQNGQQTEGLVLEKDAHKDRVRTLQYYAHIWFNSRNKDGLGVDPATGKVVIAFADSPWDEDEAVLLQ